MAGLDTEQWAEVNKRLKMIDEMHDDLLIMKTKLGYEDGNGLFGRVSALEKRPGKFLKWIPVLICIALFCITVYDRLNEPEKRQIVTQQIVVTPDPTP